MVDQVTFPPSIGGTGKTYTSDANPETGVFGGAHRVNFFPMIGEVVGVGVYVSQYAQAIDGAKANADRAENARGYVEAVADAYKVNILEQFKRNAALGLDFSQGRYFVDDGVQRLETLDFDTIGVSSASTACNEEFADGEIKEHSIDSLARRWLNGKPLGVSLGGARTNKLLFSHDFNNGVWIGRISWDVSALQSPFSENYYNYTASINNGPAFLSQDISGGAGRVTLSLFVGDASDISNVIFYIDDKVGNSSRASVRLSDLTITADNDSGNPVVYFEPCVGGKRIGVSFDGFEVATQRVGVVFKNSDSSISFSSDLNEGNKIYIIGMQFEHGECFGGYIKTTSSSVTRSSRTCENNLNPAHGGNITIYLEFYRLFDTSSGFEQAVLELRSQSDLLAIESSYNNTRIRTSFVIPNTLNYQPNVSLKSVNKLALTVGDNYTAISVNGESKFTLDDNTSLISFLRSVTTISPKRGGAVAGMDYRPVILVSYKSLTISELNALTAGGAL